MSVLLVEKINHKFKTATNSRKQASGLSVCLGMIAGSIDGVFKVEVDTMEHVELAIQRFKPQKIVLQAIWASHEALQTLRRKFPSKQFYIHIHSNIPFLACEGYALERLNEAKDLGVGIIFNDMRASSALGGIYLPNIYAANFRDIKQSRYSSTVDIACCGSLRTMKNQVIQAMAAIKYADCLGKKLRLHMNLVRNEGGEDVKMNLKSLFRANPSHELISIPWLEHHDFIEYLSGVDMGLQVSMTESFNIVAADYCAAGIPMVVSEEIEWASPNSKAPCGDVNMIVEKMIYASDHTEDNRSNLYSFSERSKRLWREFSA